MDISDQTTTFTGSVERITYFNDENGYSVLKVRPDKRMTGYTSRDGLVTVVGIMPELGVGEDVEFNGYWVDDPKYGMQMRVETVSPIMPDTAEGLKRFLASGIVKGIGPATAKNIVDHFGEDTLKVLNNEPERLKETIKHSLAEKLAKAWEENVQVRQTMIFLQGHGVSSRMATRIHSYYGSETINRVQDDPYTLADEVFGIGFIKADQIARNMGIEDDAPERLRAGLQYALNRLALDGHTFAPRDEMINTAAELLNVQDKNALEAVLDKEIAAANLIEDHISFNGADQRAVYLPSYYRAETDATDCLRAITNMPSVITEDSAEVEWDSYLNELAKKNNVTLTEQQQGAVRAALERKVSILTGGPGTGKTTTLQMVISALEEGDYSYALASPTGRAAKRLGEATGRDAYTIHRLFGFKPGEGFEYDEDDPLDVQMLIIDEASMIDLQLFNNVLRGLAPETHLMLVGDVDQLPSVSAGNVLNDVINSGVAYVTRLNTIFRQSEDSHIIVNAHRVNQGEAPYTDNKSQDFYFFGQDDPTAAADMLVDVVVNRIPSKFGYHPVNDVQVIAPMYRGAAGVDNLNNALQNALNPSRPRNAEKKLGSRIFRTGDKVMQTRNNYDKDVYNGDIGYVRAIDDDDNLLELTMGEDILDYDYSEIDELIHAYCISIHRSQGSEYPVVVIPLLTQHYMMLQRNLLYTAITRAREMVVLVGSRKAVQMAVRNNKVSKRYSGLLARLTS